MPNQPVPAGRPSLGVLRSGGQSGVDRAALDVARELGLPIAGWCPRGGWAEDRPRPPGLLADYPELAETPSGDVAQRTIWNVRDSDATLLILPDPDTASAGTELTRRACADLGRPLFVLRDDVAAAREWLAALPPGSALNVAGPRESESPGAYQRAGNLLRRLLT